MLSVREGERSQADRLKTSVGGSTNSWLAPELSIVIPTFNRADRVRACLDALARQTQPPSDFEVVVVDDGSSDGTAEMLEGLSTPFALRVVRQENQGNGGARNNGAEVASGRCLLFLDDDVVASSVLVAEHLRAQRENGGAVVIAPYLLPERGSRLARGLARSRLEFYERLAARPLRFRDCWSGNLSLPRSDFLAVGGFATDLCRAVDIELGYRLYSAGVPFVFAPRAVGYEDDRESSRDRLIDAELRGATDVELWRRHPDMISTMEIGGRWQFRRSLILLRRGLLWLHVPPRLLDLFGNLLPRESWLVFWYEFVVGYCCYWRGVRRAADRNTWQQLIRGTPILMYHAVGGPGERADRHVVPARRLERQLRWLERRGYQVIGLEELVSCVRERRLPPAQSVVLTFDDGLADSRLLAAPILERLGLPATFFLEPGSIAFDQAREQVGGVIRFGARTRTHLDLARSELESALGVPVTAFAYPDGEAGPEIQEAVREAGFLGACTTVSGRNRLASDPYALRRLEVRGTDSLIRFALTLWVGDTHRRTK